MSATIADIKDFEKMDAGPKADAKPLLITYDNLDEIFTYHAWSPEQIERGNAIRAAAKAVAKNLLDHAEAVKAFQEAVKNSAMPAPENPSLLYRYAQERRAKAVAAFSAPLEMMAQDAIGTINEMVMLANSAITFEAAELHRDNPPKEARS